jgi:ATP-binding cassette subfamily B protein
MVIQDPVMSLFALVIAPPALFVLRKLIRRVRTIAKSQFTGGTRLFETMQETIQGIRIVKTIHARRSDARADEEEYRDRRRRSQQDGARRQPLEPADGDARAASRSRCGVTYGGYRTIETGATPGEFFSFITAFILAYEPAKRLARLNLELNAGLVGVRILFDIIDAPQTEPNDANKPALKIEDAGWRSPTSISPIGRANRSCATCHSWLSPARRPPWSGRPAAASPTILNLILRLYEINSGTIVIDGQDIAGVSRKSLRQGIGYVGQDVFLFRGTIRENIAFGKPDATEAEIVAAAEGGQRA